VKILFGDIIAEEAAKGTFLVRKGDELASPYEYAHFWRLTPKSCALKRDGDRKVDILFSNGRWFFGAVYAFKLFMDGRGKHSYLVAILVQRGTHVLDDEGYYFAFIPRHLHTRYLSYWALIPYRPKGPIPYVRVCDLHGHLLSEDEL